MKKNDQVGVPARNRNFYHCAKVTRHDSKTNQTTVDYIYCDWVTGKVSLKYSKEMVQLNNLQTIKTKGHTKRYVLNLVVECMDNALPYPLPANMPKQKTKKPDPVRWKRGMVVDSWRVFTLEECDYNPKKMVELGC